MKTYINKIKSIETIDYQLPINYEFIRTLNFYSTDRTLDKFIQDCIDKNEKAILFIQSATKAYELFKKYKDRCLFNCSTSNKLYKHVNAKKINEMLVKKNFNESILITTTCLDTGVDIIDSGLKHILCEVEDTGTLIQCIGRKRIQHPLDQIHLYIRIINNNSLGGKYSRLSKKIEMSNFLKKHTVKEFIEKYKREHDINDMVYDAVVNEEDRGTKKVNDLMFFKAKIDMCEIKRMLGDRGYCEYIRGIFGMDSYNIVEKDDKKLELLSYLKGASGKKLLKAEQKELITAIGIKDRRGRVQKSISLLNAYLMENRFDYRIIADTDRVRKLPDGSPNPQRGKVYWELDEIGNSTPNSTND